MTLVKSVLTSQSVYLLTALDAPKEVSEYINSKRTFSGHWSFFLCFLWNHLLSEIWNDKKWKQRVLSLSFFPVPRVGDCLYIQYNDEGTPSTSTQLRCSCKAVETLPSTTAFRAKLQYLDHISSRGSSVAKGGEHSASTAKSFTTFRHGSPNTSLVTLMEHLLLPTQAWRYGKQSIMTPVHGGYLQWYQVHYWVPWYPWSNSLNNEYVQLIIWAELMRTCTRTRYWPGGLVSLPL